MKCPQSGSAAGSLTWYTVRWQTGFSNMTIYSWLKRHLRRKLYAIFFTYFRSKLKTKGKKSSDSPYMSNVETKEWRSFDPDIIRLSRSTYYPQFRKYWRAKNLLEQQPKLASFEEKGNNHHVLIDKVKRLRETWYHIDIVQMQIQVARTRRWHMCQQR